MPYYILVLERQPDEINDFKPDYTMSHPEVSREKIESLLNKKMSDKRVTYDNPQIIELHMPLEEYNKRPTRSFYTKAEVDAILKENEKYNKETLKNVSISLAQGMRDAKSPMGKLNVDTATHIAKFFAPPNAQDKELDKKTEKLISEQSAKKPHKK